MAVKLNREALDHALKLIDEGEYAINTVWGSNQPNAEQENKYVDKHGWGDYAKWFLAVDTDQNDATKEAHKFPYGDFKRVHRSGLIAAKQRAEQQGYHDVAEGADELLSIFDRLNAC